MHFPEVLDLTPFTTSGMLSTSPSFPISSHIPPTTTTIAAAAAASLAIPLSKSKTHPTRAPPQAPRVLYRLAAVVCHYGQHSFGHYVCFRRKPRGAGRVVPPQLEEGPPTGRGWLRVSDDAVREVGIETVLLEGAGAFMLYYERVVGEDGLDRQHAWEAGTGSGGSSHAGGESVEKAQQTLTVVVEDPDPEKHAQLENVVAAVPPPPAVIKARVVRSVSLGPDEVLGGTSVKREVVEAEVVVDPESCPSVVEEPIPAAAPAVELPLAATSVKAPSPIPEPPVVDEPPISLPRTVDLRA